MLHCTYMHIWLAKWCQDDDMTLCFDKSWARSNFFALHVFTVALCVETCAASMQWSHWNESGGCVLMPCYCQWSRFSPDTHKFTIAQSQTTILLMWMCSLRRHTHFPDFHQSSTNWTLTPNTHTSITLLSRTTNYTVEKIWGVMQLYCSYWDFCAAIN